MNALKICNKITNNIEEDSIYKGQVHSVFHHAVNIKIKNHGLMTLVHNDPSMGPMSILLKEHQSFKNLGILEGMEVYLRKDSLVINDLKIRIDLKKAKIFDSKPRFDFLQAKEDKILERLRAVEHSIYTMGNFDGIAPLVFILGDYFCDLKPFVERDIIQNQYVFFIKERLITFIKLLYKNDITNISKAVQEIIGFGPGLTPSVDDFISGLMTAFIYLSYTLKLNELKIKALNRAIIKEIENKTTDVSQGMLIFSSEGEVNESVRDLMIAMVSESSLGIFKEKLERVIGFGSTSGTDIVCGIYIGFRLMLNNNFRRLFLDEDLS